MTSLDGLCSFFQNLGWDTAMISGFRNMFAKVVSDVLIIIRDQARVLFTNSILGILFCMVRIVFI